MVAGRGVGDSGWEGVGSGGWEEGGGDGWEGGSGSWEGERWWQGEGKQWWLSLRLPGSELAFCLYLSSFKCKRPKSLRARLFCV